MSFNKQLDECKINVVIIIWSPYNIKQKAEWLSTPNKPLKTYNKPSREMTTTKPMSTPKYSSNNPPRIKSIRNASSSVPWKSTYLMIYRSFSKIHPTKIFSNPSMFTTCTLLGSMRKRSSIWRICSRNQTTPLIKSFWPRPISKWIIRLHLLRSCCNF